MSERATCKCDRPIYWHPWLDQWIHGEPGTESDEDREADANHEGDPDDG